MTGLTDVSHGQSHDGSMPRGHDGPVAHGHDGLPAHGHDRPVAHGPDRPVAHGHVGAALIRLDRASLQFGAVRALHDVSLELHRGERLALVGANGSGKTSLLRLLNGLVPPSSGQRRLLHAPGLRPLRTAMLFQRPFLLHLSVRRNLQLALWLAGVPGVESAARLDEALHRVGLQALAQRAARSLSGGQQQRLALARAWAVHPDILFLDEPTASLDPSAKQEVEDLIEEFGHSGMSLVMSTHNLGQAKRLASRVLHLQAGHVLADLPAEAFFNTRALPEATLQFLKGELPWV